MSGFKLPAKKRVDPEELAEFAGQAVRKETKQEEIKEALDDKRRTPAFAMRLTERELALLRGKAKTSPDSMHSYCIKALREKLGIV